MNTEKGIRRLFRHRKNHKLNRSRAGNALMFAVMIICGIFMAVPLVMILNNAFKPFDELFRYPPKLFVQNPTTANSRALLVLMNNSWVPFSRYLLNTFILVGFGTIGHIILASMAAYPLAKIELPGKKALFGIVVLALMFNGTVTSIPNYMIISYLGLNNTYLALLLPAFSSSLGLYLMKQFMEQIPDALLESARLDGAGEMKIFLNIVMPNVKPAWLTLIIFSVQNLWNNKASTFIYSEERKTLVYALQQIQSGGVARTGQSAAVTVIVMMVPIVIFILSESQILETMASSGLKE
jgi:ABC-type glycerol-3-phosphate transport system permease component